MQVLTFIKENYLLIIAILTFIEFLLRVIPTYKNYSIIEFIKLLMLGIHQLIDSIIPNKKL